MKHITQIKKLLLTKRYKCGFKNNVMLNTSRVSQGTEKEITYYKLSIELREDLID